MNQQMANRQQAAPSNPSDGDKLSTWLEHPQLRARIEQALPPGVDADNFLSQVYISLQAPEVRNCSVTSQFEAANTLALLGLLPSLKQAALIPRAGAISVMPQWQGYKALMERHPAILEVTAHLIHKVDTYEFDDGGRLVHHFDPFDPNRVFRGIDDLTGGYAVAVFRDGRAPKYHFCNSDYIAKCMKCAQTKNVWNAWFEQMARKTCYRSMFTSNVIPMDPMVQRQMGAVIEHDDILLDNNPTVTSGTPAALPASRAKQLANQIVAPPSLPPQQQQPPESQDSPEDKSPNGDGELTSFQQAQADIEGAADPITCKAAFDKWKDQFTDGDAADLDGIYQDKLKTYPTTKPKKGNGQLPLQG